MVIWSSPVFAKFIDRLMAAIEAHDAKAKVLVFDRASSLRLSATNICGGGFSAAGTRLKRKRA